MSDICGKRGSAAPSGADVRECRDPVAKAHDHLKQIAMHADHWYLKLLYCGMFYLLLVASNAFAFFLSIALSRLMLREIVAAGRFFSAAAILIFDVFLVACTATMLLIFTTCLSFPSTWILLPLTYYLVIDHSVLWLPAMLFGSGILVWVFGNPWLQINALIALAPSFGTALVCLVSLVAMSHREWFHRTCSNILLRCTGTKPLSFIVGFVFIVAILITGFSRLLQLVLLGR